MEFKINSKYGITLETKDKYCTEDLKILIESANLIPENIKKGVNILGVVGTFEGVKNLLPLVPASSGNYAEYGQKELNYIIDNNSIKIFGAVSKIAWAIIRLSHKIGFAISLSEVVDLSDGKVFLEANVPYKITKTITPTSDKINFIIVYEDNSRQVYTDLKPIETFSKSVKDIWIRQQIIDTNNVDIKCVINIEKSPVNTLNIDTSDGDLGHTNVVGLNSSTQYDNLTDEEIAKIEAIRKQNGL